MAPPLYPLDPPGSPRRPDVPDSFYEPRLNYTVANWYTGSPLERIEQSVSRTIGEAQLRALEKFAEAQGEGKAYKAAVYAIVSQAIQRVREVPLSNPKLFVLNIPLGVVVTEGPYGNLSNNAEGPVEYIPLSEYDRQRQQYYATRIIDALRLWNADP